MANLGSFAAPLAIPEALRPWAQNGLTALFLPGGLPAEELTDGPAAASSAATASGSSTPAHGVSAPSASPRWPEPWKSLAERVRANPKVLITYADLAVDLSGTPHPGRRKLFRDVLAYLAWPQGTSLFWPLSALKEGKTRPAPEYFTSGARHFGVTHVACFGPDAALFAREHLSGEGDPAVLELPAPLDLVNLLPHELHIAVKSLKTLVLK